MRPREWESSGDLGDSELGTLKSDQRGREGGGIRRDQEEPPPSPQLTWLGEGAAGPVQETGPHAWVSGQTMSCLSQAAVPGAGLGTRGFSLRCSRPSTPTCPVPHVQEESF